MLTIPSLSLLIPWSSILSLVLSRPPATSPSGGPSFMSLSSGKESAAADLLPTKGGRRPAVADCGEFNLVTSLFDLVRWTAPVFAAWD